MASNAERNPIDALAEEFAERYRRGERPPLTEYTSKYPHLAAEIQELFPALVVMEQLKPADESSELGFSDGKQPDRIGDYRVLRKVGRGGMGIVYEAEQVSLGRHVALKVVPVTEFSDPVYLERFRREARAAARLHHTNIVPVFGVGESEGALFYAMQFIHGEGLDRVLNDVRTMRAASGSPVDATGPPRTGDAGSVARSLVSGRWSVPAPPPENSGAQPTHSLAQAPPGTDRLNEPSVSLSSGGSEREYCRSVARVGLQVAEALAYAHRQGILHRDIKPSNLLLDVQGTVWITDFGLAKSEGVEDLTHTGDIVGTVRYMAPERFEGDSLPQSDVYGLGVTLYEMLTLRPAFDDSNRARLIERIGREDAPPLRKSAPQMPRDLDTIVQKCIARHPRDRYTTAEDVAEDLRRFLSDRPILARRTSATERLWRWSRRNPIVASLVMALGVILTGSVVGLTGLYLNLRIAAAEAREGEARARQAESDSKAVLTFFQDRVLAAARPKGHPSGLGADATIRAAIDQAEPGIARAFAEQPLSEASIREVLGLTYLSLNDFPSAIKQHERALDLRRAHLPPDDPDTLSSIGSLADDYQAIGRLAEALPLHEEALKLRETRLGPNHPRTLVSMSHLAQTLDAAGRRVEAVPLYEEVVRRSTVSRGRDDLDTLNCMIELANAYVALGRPGEAMPLFEEAMRRLPNARLGPDNEFDRWHQMDQLRNNLGWAFYDAGRWREAMALHAETLKDRKARLGPDDEDTLKSMGGLAASYVDAGRLAEALPLFEELLKRHKARNGPDDSQTLAAMGNVAVVYRDLGRLDEARVLFREMLSRRKTKLGADDPFRLSYMNHAATCLIKMKRYDEAVDLLRESQMLLERKDPKQWRVFWTKSQLGQSMTGLKRYTQAEALLQEAYKEMTAQKDKLPAWTFRYTKATAQGLVDLYEAWGKKEQAAQWRQQLAPSTPPTPVSSGTGSAAAGKPGQ
jgi:serine/threonine protein kinase/tetratricopeptide (TPR) repeat protein